MIAESTELAQLEKPVASTSAEDNALQTLTAELSTMVFVPDAVALEATTVTVPEVPVMTSALTNSAASLFSILSEMAPASTDIIRTVIERGSGSAPVELALATDIMEELARQMV